MGRHPAVTWECSLARSRRQSFWLIVDESIRLLAFSEAPIMPWKRALKPSRSCCLSCVCPGKLRTSTGRKRSDKPTRRGQASAARQPTHGPVGGRGGGGGGGVGGGGAHICERWMPMSK